MQTKYYGTKMRWKRRQMVIPITDSCTCITDIDFSIWYFKKKELTFT